MHDYIEKAINYVKLGFGQYLFLQFVDFIYLKVNTNQNNGMHNEVELQLATANRGYHTMRNMFSSIWLLS